MNEQGGMIMDKSLRSVFVGNIPYEATEEKLKDIFNEVGQVGELIILFFFPILIVLFQCLSSLFTTERLESRKVTGFVSTKIRRRPCQP